MGANEKGAIVLRYTRWVVTMTPAVANLDRITLAERMQGPGGWRAGAERCTLPRHDPT